MSNIQPRYTIVRRGKLVTFFKNGDPFYKGLQTSVSGKHFVTLSTLKSWLNNKIPLISGIKHIFRLPDGIEISDVTQFEAGKSYVVSNVRKFNSSIKYDDPLVKLQRNFDQLGDDLYLDKSFYNPPADEVKRLTPSHYKSEPDFGAKQRRHKENVSSMLDDQQNIPPAIDREFVHPPNDASRFKKRGSFTYKDSFDTDSLGLKRREDSFDELNDSNLTSPSQVPKYSEMEHEIGEGRRRSKATSIESSAESSGSGSGKLSSLDQPRNKTFFPLDRSRQEKVKKPSNILPKLSQLPERKRQPYKRQDTSSKEELDNPYNFRQRPPHARNRNTDGHLPSIVSSYPPSLVPRSAEEFARNSPTGKLWSPISLKDRQHKDIKPRIIQMISNVDRNSSQRVIFNPRTLQSFEEVLKDLENLVSVPYPPVTGIYAAEEPFIKVHNLSHLSGELRHCDDFLVCGKEGVPLEVQNYSKNMETGSLGRRSNASTIKGYRSEGRLDSALSSHVSNRPRRFARIGRSEPSLERNLKPVNLYLNKQPTNENIQITVGCQSQNCDCRLHETLSQLLINQ